MTGPIVDREAGTLRRLHLNESPYPPAPSVVQAIAEAATTANRYPPTDEAGLVNALARYSGADAERLVLSSGSNELLHLMPMIAKAEGAEIVIPEPSFPTYGKVAGFFGITAHCVPVAEDGRADVEAMLAAITPACRLICVASPNNPTGGLLSQDEIVHLAESVPETVLLHFDEAYYEFGRQAGGGETLPLLARRKGPWLSTRSFSKAFGLAGVRLGYAIAGELALAQRIRALRPNFSVNALAVAAGRAALADEAYMRATIEKVAVERERIAEGLRKLGFAPLPSAANFVAFPLPERQSHLPERLQEKGVLIGTFPLPGQGAAARVTVGTRDDTDALLEAVAACLEHR